MIIEVNSLFSHRLFLFRLWLLPLPPLLVISLSYWEGSDQEVLSIQANGLFSACFRFK